jgi:hypothetical protein
MPAMCPAHHILLDLFVLMKNWVMKLTLVKRVRTEQTRALWFRSSVHINVPIQLGSVASVGNPQRINKCAVCVA